MYFTEKNLTRFNEDNQQIKRDKIVIMKIQI